MRVSEGTALGSFWPTEKKATTESARYDCRDTINGRLCLNVVRNDDGGLSMSDRWRHRRGPQKRNNAD